MKLAVLCIEPVDADLVKKIPQHPCTVFVDVECSVLKETMPVPRGAYNVMRHQHNSTVILAAVDDFVKKFDADRVLGVTAVDLYVPGLNFVFGEAHCPGKVAIISLFRLRPEFYGQPANDELYLERTVKEAIHEIGHTLALGHCQDAFCVMHFSNNIQMTDAKQAKFCQRCRPKVLTAIAELRKRR